jgi:quercetin dioxygenase-like cupin family protein
MRIERGHARNSASGRRADTFTGEVWADSVLPTTDGTTINVVTFTPGARTHWHSHREGQVLQVLAGQGWVCSAGGTPQRLLPGDTVWVPPGERHWHGATHTTLMSHTAISLGPTDWLDAVSEQDYAAAGPADTEQ